MADLSLDELARRRGISTRGNTRPIFTKATGGMRGTFDARQKIGVTDIRQRTGARGGFPLKDAREKLVQREARFQSRGGPSTAGVQDARETINSRKQQLGQKQLHNTLQLQGQNSSQGFLQMHAPRTQTLSQSGSVVVHSSVNVNSAQGLNVRGGTLEHGGRPNKLVDARDRLSLKRSIAVALPTPGAPSPLKITKTIQQRPVGITSGIHINIPSRDSQSLSGEDDASPSKQMKPGVTGSLFSGPITKVVKNDSYTAPLPPVPDAPPRAAPALPASLSSPSVLKAVSRTLVTGLAQQGGSSGEASSHPATVQPACSPLEGTKMTVNNLHPRVTEEDIVELFCVSGALKRARLVKAGVAEVVFVRKEDAVAAYKKYNHRCLDGLPMKCNLHIQGSIISSDQPILLRLSDTPGGGGGGKKEGLPASLSRQDGRRRSSQPTPEVDPQTILKALFKSSSHTATSTRSPSTAFSIKI
ncbi:polymerase delta-interacting protein 3-like [Conger conger]|uniref:polymerase delta-interacting protein 3-like n=1 Tax=Conger conger TaxID=82655 RepID=UPI002A5AFEF3|nr:polymerase delta-interacting protein 3-like [Conger conger]